MLIKYYGLPLGVLINEEQLDQDGRCYTWVHCEVAAAYARWASVELGVQTRIWIDDLRALANNPTPSVEVAPSVHVVHQLRSNLEALAQSLLSIKNQQEKLCKEGALIKQQIIEAVTKQATAEKDYKLSEYKTVIQYAKENYSDQYEDISYTTFEELERSTKYFSKELNLSTILDKEGYTLFHPKALQQAFIIEFAY